MQSAREMGWFKIAISLGAGAVNIWLAAKFFSGGLAGKILGSVFGLAGLLVILATLFVTYLKVKDRDVREHD
jgi:hypothetical protein